MTNHTPTPWELEIADDTIYIWSTVDGCRGAAIAKLKLIGQPDNLDFDTSERIARANAEFIVRACNSYDQWQSHEGRIDIKMIKSKIRQASFAKSDFRWASIAMAYMMGLALEIERLYKILDNV